jgi:hypothetical protein
VQLAGAGELTQPGDPFELPHFPTIPKMTLAFREDMDSFLFWSGQNVRYGLVSLARLGECNCVVVEHKSVSGDSILKHEWGTVVRKNEDLVTGGWVMLGSVPLVRDFQAPATWGDLLKVRSFEDRFWNAASRLRDGQPHVVLVGFPIPRLVGGRDCAIWWQALLLPALACRPKPGFRNGEPGYRKRDKQSTLRPDEPVVWVRSQNWAPEELSTRGILPGAVRSMPVLIIGAGALGSAVAQMLIRGGVAKLTIIDGDLLEGGNLVRHTLGVHDISRNKAKALAEQLIEASPHAQVTAIEDWFPPVKKADAEQVGSCYLVIDCTASDEVMAELQAYPWPAERLFVSLSVGFGAKRLFCFAARSNAFPRHRFIEQYASWADKEREETTEESMPWEGIGCWHRVFPADTADVWLMAAVAVKYVAESASSGEVIPDLMVYQQAHDDFGFAGVVRASCEGSRGQ